MIGVSAVHFLLSDGKWNKNNHSTAALLFRSTLPNGPRFLSHAEVDRCRFLFCYSPSCRPVSAAFLTT